MKFKWKSESKPQSTWHRICMNIWLAYGIPMFAALFIQDMMLINFIMITIFGGVIIEAYFHKAPCPHCKQPIKPIKNGLSYICPECKEYL